MTQKECADTLGITLRAWQTYEQGVSEPKQELLCRIADMFNVSLDHLLNREPSTPEAPTDPLSQLDLSPLEKRFINGYLKLNNSTRSDIMDCLYNTVEQVRENEESENNQK